METVVAKEGTGKKAVVPGYRVAGKTGTARIAGKNGDDMDRHIASFAGISRETVSRTIKILKDKNILQHDNCKNIKINVKLAKEMLESNQIN